MFSSVKKFACLVSVDSLRVYAASQIADLKMLADAAHSDQRSRATAAATEWKGKGRGCGFVLKLPIGRLPL